MSADKKKSVKISPEAMAKRRADAESGRKAEIRQMSKKSGCKPVKPSKPHKI